MLEVRRLEVPRAAYELDLTAARGTVTCLAGQVGSGVIETLRALAGLVADATGEVAVDGIPYALRSVPRAREAGVLFISEDRAGEGIFLRLTVAENLVATQLDEFTRFGVFQGNKLRAAVRSLASAVGVDLARLGSRADDLSGGNQQKLAFGRQLGRQAAGVLLMNEPTRGVDVGARAEIYRLIREFCDLGYAVVMASSDLEEVLGMSDVIVTMYRGRRVAQYRREQASMHQILADITHPAGGA
jgi:ABC-type sugar transport system ATPase subunit